MGQEFLIDTNSVIYYLNGTLPEKGIAFLDNILPAISIISRIELLGWNQITAEELHKLNSFVADAMIYPLSETTILKTIELKQAHKIKTPDGIIAATALVHNLTLITRNTSDFKQIPGLGLVNPFEL